MANINFYLKPGPQNRNGKKSIIMRITFSNQQTTLFINKMTYPKYWNNNRQNVRASGKNEPDNNYQNINETIVLFRNKAEEAIRHAIKNNLTLSAKYFKNWFQHGQPQSSFEGMDFLTVFDHYLESLTADRAPQTIRGYKTVRVFLDRFEKDTGYVLDFNTINNMFFDELRRYAFHERNAAHNYFAKIISVLKSFLYWAGGRDVKVTDHFKKFTFQEKDKEVIFLTLDELMRLYNYEFSSRSHIKARDLFCFGCFTGLRVSDLLSLKKEHIKDGYIRKTIQKARDPLTIPLNEFSTAILEKYKDSVTGPLPVLSAQKLNDYIKECCKIAEINAPTMITLHAGGKTTEVIKPKYELVSSHIARKTFITNSIMLGMNYMAAKGISGHKKEKNFNKYVKIAEDFKKTEMERTWGQLKKK